MFYLYYIKYSRDTTVKIWSIEKPSKIDLIHSFGGHSSTVTFVKFWKYQYFKACLENILKQDKETDQFNRSIILPDGLYYYLSIQTYIIVFM